MGNGNRPTPEFRREAVRLALTSGRTRRKIAEDLGIGLSTLTRWLNRERDAGEPGEASVDLHAELKRLRRENAVLKQERDILKKGETIFRHWSEDNGRTPSSRKTQVDELRFHRGGEGQLLYPADVQGSRSQPERVLRLEGSSCLSSPAAGHDPSCPHPNGLCAVERDLRQSPHAPRSRR